MRVVLFALLLSPLASLVTQAAEDHADYLAALRKLRSYERDSAPPGRVKQLLSDLIDERPERAAHYIELAAKKMESKLPAPADEVILSEWTPDKLRRNANVWDELKLSDFAADRLELERSPKFGVSARIALFRESPLLDIGKINDCISAGATHEMVLLAARDFWVDIEELKKDIGAFAPHRDAVAEITKSFGKAIRELFFLTIDNIASYRTVDRFDLVRRAAKDLLRNLIENNPSLALHWVDFALGRYGRYESRQRVRLELLNVAKETLKGIPGSGAAEDEISKEILKERQNLRDD